MRARERFFSIPDFYLLVKWLHYQNQPPAAPHPPLPWKASLDCLFLCTSHHHQSIVLFLWERIPVVPTPVGYTTRAPWTSAFQRAQPMEGPARVRGCTIAGNFYILLRPCILLCSPHQGYSLSEWNPSVLLASLGDTRPSDIAGLKVPHTVYLFLHSAHTSVMFPSLHLDLPYQLRRLS